MQGRETHLGCLLEGLRCRTSVQLSEISPATSYRPELLEKDFLGPQGGQMCTVVSPIISLNGGCEQERVMLGYQSVG